MSSEELVFFDEEVKTKAASDEIEFSLVKAAIGRQEACVRSLVDKYRDTRSWVHTMEQVVENAKEPVQVINWGVELSSSRALFRLLHHAVSVIAPEKLPYLEGGGVDDCTEITNQSAIVEIEGVEQVVPNGPEYYGASGAYVKNEWQLVATDANYEICVLREELYGDENPNTWTVFDPYGSDTARIYNTPAKEGMILPKGGWGPNVGELLRWIWRNEEKERELTIDKLTPVYMPVLKLHKLTGKWTDGDKVIKVAHPVHKMISAAIQWMSKHDILDVKKIDGKWYVATKISRMDYLLNDVDLEDNFNLISRRDKFQALCYYRDETWYPRIGIITNGDCPLFVRKDWKPKQEWEQRITKCHLEEVFSKGGISFKGSWQLSPALMTDYDKSENFSYRPMWGDEMKSVFLSKLKNGTTKTCIKREEKKTFEHKFNKAKNEWEKVHTDTKVKLTRQAYWVAKIPRGSFLKRFPDEASREAYVVLFTDIQGEPFAKRIVGHR